MPKYWGKQIFTHGRFPEVGQKQKTEKKKKKKEKKEIASLSVYCIILCIDRLILQSDICNNQ